MAMSMLEQLKLELKKAEGELEALAKVQQKVEGLRMAIAALSGEPVVIPQGAKSKEFEDLGVTGAAKRFLREMGEPQDTRSIADALLNRGLKTNSKNFIATVYATLNNGRMFKRTKDGRWKLEEENGEV